MNDYTASTYGDQIADVYDEFFPAPSDLPAAISMLSGFAGSGRALELGIGTGRFALPLRSAGVDVHGIDASLAMLSKLRVKPGGDAVPVTLADFAIFELEYRYRLIYVVFNTFFGLLTQDAQVSCFNSVAHHLEGDGVFVMEAFVPDVTRFERGQRVAVSAIGTGRVHLEMSQYFAVAQTVQSYHVIMGNDGLRLYPVNVRYAFVSELDLMARIAGMTLRERWANWNRSTFEEGSTRHISVWTKPQDA
jgi:SAM-dependent methyltransferase